METYYVIEFGKEHWSFGGRYEDLETAKRQEPRFKVIYKQEWNTRVVKVTRETRA